MDDHRAQRRRASPLVLAAALAAMGPAAAGQEWARFRGPNGTGIGQGDAIPATWTKADYNWRVKLPGAGHGSPVLWGDRIFLAGCEERTDKRMVLCLAAVDGRVLWTRPYGAEPFRMNRLNSYAGCTPAADKDRVYVCWPSRKRVLLVALDHKGREVWRRELGPHDSMHGPCGSPIVHRDTVVLANDQQGESFLLAVDAATGKTRWRLPRKSGRAAYGTPCVRRLDDGSEELLFSSTIEGIVGVDSRRGTVNWQRTGLFPQRCVGSPVAAFGLVIASCGTGSRGVRMVAVRPAAGKQPEIAYEMRRHSPYVPTPLIRGELMFTLSDTGTVTCLRVKTGEKVWQQRIGGGYYASPVCVAGRLYCVSRKGEAVVLAAADTYKLLARIDLGEMTHATPAVAGGRMYLKTYSHLISLGGSK
jgi:outer membrane protein assembly factor BamB